MTRSALAATVGFVVGLFVCIAPGSFAVSAPPTAEAGGNKCEKACSEQYSKCVGKPSNSAADCSAARKACVKSCK
jgi:hypothetical protein